MNDKNGFLIRPRKLNVGKIIVITLFSLAYIFGLYQLWIIHKQIKANDKSIVKIENEAKRQEITVDVVTANPSRNQMGKDSTMTASMKRIRLNYMCQERWCALSDTLAKRLKVKLKDTIFIPNNQWFGGWWVYRDRSKNKKDMRVELYLPINEIGGKWKQIKITKK